MEVDDIITLIFLFLFFIGPMFLRIFRKKKSPIPKSKEDFERLYKIKTEEAKRREHLKPPPLQPPIHEYSIKPIDHDSDSVEKTEPIQSLSIDLPSRETKTLSSSYSPGFDLESTISSRHIESSVKERHIESGIEELGYRSLLQERFAQDVFEEGRKPSYVRDLLSKASKKDMIILNEILNRPF